MAFLVVLESMTRPSGVAFVLHDVFRYSFPEIAEITGRTPAACRQLASSARGRIRAAQPPAAPPARQAGLVRDFKQAWEAKDIEALVALLDPRRHGGGRRRRPGHRRAPPHRRPRGRWPATWPRSPAG